MKVQIKFFARLRDQLDCSELAFELDQGCDVQALKQRLYQRGAAFESALQSGRVLMAVNHQQVSDTHLLQDGDEVAFFPPVTGG